jgi:CRISPR-associated endonuclease Cas1
MKINELQHPNSVWTWKNNSRRQKASLWLPYFSGVTKVRGDRYCFEYNGGEVTAHLKQIDFIMLYGATGELPVQFLDALNNYKIPLVIHRRNLSDPYLFLPTYHSDRQDILTAQIMHRQNQVKATYIAKTILRERIKRMHLTISISDKTYCDIASARSVVNLRNIEAQVTKRYWQKYYENANCAGTLRRDPKVPINQALNAGSLFLSGIILRWVLYHRLSPQHGFLHIQSSYPSLIYDLMEPFRFIIEDATLLACQKATDDKKLVGLAIDNIKRSLEQSVYIPATRQQVYRKSTIHGIVLALRAYLIGDMQRLVIPTEGEKKGGRPVKISYRLPGEIKV